MLLLNDMEQIKPQYGDSDFIYPNIETLRWAVNRHPAWFDPSTLALVNTVQAPIVQETLALDQNK